MRDRLIELIGSKVCEDYSPTCDEWQPHSCEKCFANDCRIGELADHLIANGVIVPPSSANVPGRLRGSIMISPWKGCETMKVFEELNEFGEELCEWLVENWCYMAAGALLFVVGLVIGYDIAWMEFEDLLKEIKEVTS